MTPSLMGFLLFVVYRANTYNVLYNLSLYFRGYPIAKRGYSGTGYVFGTGSFNDPYVLEKITVNPSKIIEEEIYVDSGSGSKKVENTAEIEAATIIKPNNPAGSSTKVGIIQNQNLAKKAKLINMYGTEFIAPPKRYRCTTNALILIQDNEIIDDGLGIIALKDLEKEGGFLPSTSQAPTSTEAPFYVYLPEERRMGNLDLSNLSKKDKAAYVRTEEGTIHLPSKLYEYPLHYTKSVSIPGLTSRTREIIPVVEEAMSNVLTRKFTKESMHDKAYKDVDAANIAWGSDKFSIPQKLQINFILYDDSVTLPGHPTSKGRMPTFKKISKKTGGKIISLNGKMSAAKLYNAIDTIISDIVKSTSNAQVSTSQFQKTDNSVRYTFKYNLASRRGEVIAHKADKESIAGWNEFDEENNPLSLWNSETSFNAKDGRLITMDYRSSTPLPATISMETIKPSYDRGREGTDFLHDNHIKWLKGEEVVDDISLQDEQQAYHKVSSIGPVINSNVELFAHDVEYINLSRMGGEVKKQFNQYILYKNKELDRDYMIVNANDGMVHFLAVPRSPKYIEEELGKGRKVVEKMASYFPGILAHRISKLSNVNDFSYSVDGAIRLFEFKDSNGDFRSVGLSAFGAGGKGLVGYQLFKATPDNNATDHFNSPDTEIKPLFEISNEGKWTSYSPNMLFGNLGYTFSDFGFLNRAHPKNSSNGQGVAVFGNGYGADSSSYSPSSLYFIDVETGKFITEIILNDNGGGASSPALVLEKSGNYHILKKIYVGDISGRLYRVTFPSEDFMQAQVEVIYQPVNSNIYNPISVKPLVVMNGSDEWVYFGTGRKSDELLDKGKDSPSKDVQYIAGLKNPKHIKDKAITINQLQQNIFQMPVITLSVNVGGTTAKPVAKDIETLFTEKASTGGNALEKGWYLALDQSHAIDPSLKTGGERVVFSPRQSYGDVIFSTWGIDENDVSSTDPCIGDASYGKLLILDKKTGLLGTGGISGHEIGGFVIKDSTPGISSGYGIMDSLVSGESLGISSLDKETIQSLRKTADSTHALGVKGACAGSVGDDTPNIHNYTVGCPPAKKSSGRRVSIRKIN